MHRFARNVTEIESNEPEPSCLQEEIRSTKTLFYIAASDPQQPLEVNSGSFRRVWIKGVTPINQGACFGMCGSGA